MKNSIKTTIAIITIVVGITLLTYKDISAEAVTVSVGAVLILLGAKNLFFSLLESMDE